MFTKATKKRSRARVGIAGPSGGGKTYTGLIIATALADGGKVAVIDSEHGSASKYADIFEFDVLELDEFSPSKYVEAIKAAEAGGYAALLIDSLSHAWSGTGGALEMVDKAAARSRSGNSFTAWREVTPVHNALVDAMVQCKCHLIATMRAKTEYVIEDGPNGKKTPRKIGMAPVQRDGMEYEFDIFADMDHENRFIVSKTRCPALNGAVVLRPDAEFAKKILAWVSEGVDAQDATPARTDEPAKTPPKKQDAKPKDPWPATQAKIEACASAADCASLLHGWMNKKPVGQSPEFYERIYEHSFKLAQERTASGEWESDSTLPDVLTSLSGQLETLKQVESL